MKSCMGVALIAASERIVGGHSVQARALATNLSADGYDVRYIPIDVRLPRVLQWVRSVPCVRTLLNELLYVIGLYRLIDADVVHVFSASYWSFLLAPVPAILVAKLLRKPLILHYHSGEADDHLGRWRMVVRPFLRMADEIVVPSSYLGRVFGAHGYKTRVILNVVDTARFRYRERAVPALRLLSARNLERHYRVDVTIKAFARLKERFHNAELTIAGEGAEEHALRELVEQLNISGVRFAGRIDPDAMPALYDTADVFVNSSLVDNQPVSILEALAAGLPVVSTRTGDIASLLRGGEAGLLAPCDPAAIADAVERLFDEPGLGVQLTRRGREQAERHTWRYVGGDWRVLYGELASNGAGEVVVDGA